MCFRGLPPRNVNEQCSFACIVVYIYINMHIHIHVYKYRHTHIPARTHTVHMFLYIKENGQQSDELGRPKRELLVLLTTSINGWRERVIQGILILTYIHVCVCDPQH